MTNDVAQQSLDAFDEIERRLDQRHPPMTAPGCSSSAKDRTGCVYLHADLSTPEMLAPIRQLLRERFAPHLTAAATDDVVLVANELMTRSFGQDREQVTLEAVLDGNDVHLCATEGLVTRRLLDSRAQRYGLPVIEELTRAWGVKPTEGGRITWACLAAS
jgi:hypothetical protein